MKIYLVLDTNVVVSALLSSTESNPLKLLGIALDNKNKIIPVFNDEILSEYKEVLGRPKFGLNKAKIGTFINNIKSVGLEIGKAEIFENIPDPKDVVFYQVVMEAKKNDNSYLVTGNLKHFPQKSFVVTPSQMLEILESEK